MKTRELDTEHIKDRHGQFYSLTLFTPYLENQNMPPKAQDVYYPYNLLNKSKQKSYCLINQKPIRKPDTYIARQTQRNRIGSQEVNQIHLGVKHMKRVLSEIGQGKLEYSINCVVTTGQPPGSKG